MTAQRYYITMLVRATTDEDGTGGVVDAPYKYNTTADSALQARRAALEQAWRLGMSVVKFTSIRKRRVDKHF